jgi:protein involved in sex pheromone biosynthesis
MKKNLLLFVMAILAVLAVVALAGCSASTDPKVDRTKIVAEPSEKPAQNMDVVFKVGEETLDQIVKNAKFVVFNAPNGRHLCVMVVGVADGYKWCENIEQGLCKLSHEFFSIGAKTVNMTYVPYEYCEPPVPK